MLQVKDACRAAKAGELLTGAKNAVQVQATISQFNTNCYIS